MKTYREIYMIHIEAGLEPDEIRRRYALMLEDQGGNEDLTRTNLGYILGYFSDKTAQEWYAALPDVSHPIFGPSFGRGYKPTVEEAFAAGVKMAKEAAE